MIHVHLPFLKVLFLLCVAASGTQAAHIPRQDRIFSGQETHVLILPGITGGRAHDAQDLADAISRAYPDHVTFQIWDWTKVDPSRRIVSDRLLNDKRNRKRAGVLAQQISDWRKTNSDTRLVLVALSGGGRITYFLCEDPTLPPGQVFDAIILLSVAVSQKWDLQNMISRSRRGIFNYASERDSVLKTAHWIGISKPIGLHGCKESHAPIKELAWNRAMRKLKNFGGHLDCTKRPFVDLCLMPLIRAEIRDWPAACHGAKTDELSDCRHVRKP